jgi:23S rRNA pseudouridine955/2504/2580 synthase
VTADLPGHFAETMANLGFDPAEGDLPLDEPKKAPKKDPAAAAAKERRQARRGERRSRGAR